MTFFQELLKTKSVETLQKDAEGSALAKKLTAFDLTLIGIGEIIGAGIFVSTGPSAKHLAGPGLVLSYLIAAVACALAGLCYSEMAAMIPTAGSAYTYAYATCGEFVAWVLGWDLMLEYLIGASTVAAAWTQFVGSFIDTCFGTNVSNSVWFNSPVAYNSDNEFVTTGAIMNLPAAFVSLVCTFVLCVGIRQSAAFNHTLVIAKIIIVLLFLFFTFGYIQPANWTPFVPPPITDAATGTTTFGFAGVMRATTKAFFAYIGFDAVSTCSAETKNPKRDVPIGVLGSLVICTVLYILVVLNMTGIMPYSQLPESAAIPEAVKALGMTWLSIIINLGAILGLTSVILISLLGQPRIFYSMAYDGLLPPTFARIHPKFKTPFYPTLLSGIICTVASAFLPLDFLMDVTSAGTLFAFAIVSLAVAILRYTRPDIHRPFKVPGAYVIAALGFCLNIYLVFNTGMQTVLRVVIWFVLGLIVYGTYGYKNSRVRTGAPPPEGAFESLDAAEEALRAKEGKVESA